MEYSFRRKSNLFDFCCVIIRREYIYFFKPGQIVRYKLCYVRQGGFQTGHETKRFFEKN